MTKARLLVLILSVCALFPGRVLARSGLHGTVVWPAGLQRAPSFALRDQNRHLITTSKFRGHLMAITFLDSHCTKQCPIEAGELATVQRRLGSHSPLALVVISVNVKDTPRSAREFMRHVHMTGPWYWLMGTKEQLAPVWLKYGILVKPGQGDIIHSTAVYLIDKQGSIRIADAVPIIPSQFVQDVRILDAR